MLRLAPPSIPDSYGNIKKLSERRARRKQERYEKNKSAKIARLSKKYKIKQDDRQPFGKSTQPGKYLDTLKHNILREGLSMLGDYKLDTLRYCLEDCLKNDIDGDLIEAGVWKGGSHHLFGRHIESPRQQR
jgi:hypothetical protein